VLARNKRSSLLYGVSDEEKSFITSTTDVHSSLDGLFTAGLKFIQVDLNSRVWIRKGGGLIYINGLFTFLISVIINEFDQKK
jgi:hypothetical protein